ncbi:hypothetical protein H5A40_10650 [Pectobacterium brasiliense]|uniref:retron St85 family effector protein n=1 Tax=Pectobacterium brasiliense TaxID=180957 RepID=UPI001969184D|nr:retron St85 family effector protein [Pectobacterium brasiliense]QSD37523.1 hypothetical protein H5A40_10650 [Pectobacterium brasiliense]
MLMQLNRSKTELNRAIKSFDYFLEHGKIKCPGNVKKFVFLCGANKENGSPSARREELLNFSYKNLPNCHFFLAELVFKELTTNLNNSLSDNLLDVETELSNLADSIVIVLESYSSFAELGAFSYSKELRKKLIVINDTKYINANSFINHGPVKAIKDVTKNKNLLHYNMSEGTSAIERVDGIGDIFNSLYQILSPNIRTNARTLAKEDLNPHLKFDKDSVRFIHDLIFIFGPLNLREIIEVCSKIFGDSFSYKKTLQKHLGILRAINIIDIDTQNCYFSRGKTHHLKYDFDIDSVSSIFKSFILKNYPGRLIYDAI